MKQIVKRVPELDYETRYEVSIALIKSISDETRALGQPMSYLPYSPDAVLQFFLNGDTVRVMNPFEHEVLYTLE